MSSEQPSILDLAEGGFATDTLEEIKERADRSLYFFAKAICGYNLMVPHLHKVVCDWIVETTPMGGRGILMPRTHYKSTMAKAYILWKLTKNPDLRILCVGESDTVACKNLNDIKWNIQSNRLFQALYPSLVPEDFSKGWTQSSIILPRSRSYDEPTVLSAGVGAKITGLHFDIILYDDIIGLEAARSPAEMQAAINWFEMAPGLVNDPKTFEELIVGTRWKDGEADLYGWAMKRLPYKKIGDHREGFVWYVRAAIEDGKPIFPEKFTLAKLASIRRREGDYQFNANFMNDPTAPEGADFPPHWVKEYVISDDRTALIVDDERIPIMSLARVSVYDPSAGGKTARSENAICIAGMDSKRRIFCLEEWAKNCGFGEAIEEWHRFNDKWRPWKNWYEAVGAHKAVTEIVKLRRYDEDCPTCKKSHRKLNPIPFTPSGRGEGEKSKEERIRSLAQAAFEEGRVYLRAGQEKLRRQITTFPHGAMLDRFDAFAYAISMLKPPVGADEAPPRTPLVSSPRSHTTIDYGGYA